MRLRPLPFRNLLEGLEHAASGGASLTLLSWMDSDGADPVVTTKTYAEVLAGALRAAEHLRQRGVGPGTYVLTVLPNSLEFVHVFFGAQLLGAIPVPQPYPAPFDDPDALLWNFERILERTGGGVLVLSDPLMERWEKEPRLAALPRLTAPPDEGPFLDDKHRASIGADAVGFVQFTSGSTGAPKGVVLTQGNLVANCAAIGQGLQTRRGDTGVSWLPLCHDMGLIGALFSMMCHGAGLVLMSPFEFVMDPSRWLYAIGRFHGTISSSPNFGYALATRSRRGAESKTLDLSSWRMAMCGAEPVNAQTLMRFAERHAASGFRKEAFFPVYGLAEATLAVSFPPVGAPLAVDDVDRNALSDARRAIPSPAGLPWTVSLTGLGRAVAGHRVRVVDERGRTLADREVGEICVRGPSVTAGYLNDPAATSEILAGGWLHTGDLGYVADGNLFVCGRKKDVIIFRGRKYYPQDLERSVEDVEGVRKGNVIAFGEMDPGGGGESVTLVLETRLAGEEAGALVERVRARVHECSGVPVERVLPLGPGELPKTPSGKVRRAVCRQRFGKRSERLVPA